MAHPQAHRAIAAAIVTAAIGSGWSVPLRAADISPTASTVYRLGTGDKLRVIVFDEATLGGEFVIGGSGSVTLPLIGEIAAVGLTPSDLQDSIAKALNGGYVRDPRVNVEVLSYRPFYILGEVNKPGEYPYANGLTVMNAIAQAQGFTYRASVHKVLIQHAGERDEKELRLSPSMQVAPGDTVRVKERWF